MLEAAIFVSVLLGLVEQIVHLGTDPSGGYQTVAPSSAEENDKREFASCRRGKALVTGIAYASKGSFENCASKHVPYCCTRAPGYFCHCQDSRLFRSSLDLGPHSLLPWRLARYLLPSGSPRLKTSIKNPRKYERVRPRRCLAQKYLSFRGIGSFELIASLDLCHGITMLKLYHAKTK